MNESSLVAHRAIGSNEGIGGDGLTEHLNTQNVHDDFFSFFFEVRVNQGNVIVCGDDVSEGRKPFLDTLDNDLIGQGVSDVLEF